MLIQLIHDDFCLVLFLACTLSPASTSPQGGVTGVFGACALVPVAEECHTKRGDVYQGEF